MSAPVQNRICVRCGLDATLDWDNSPEGVVHEHQSGCIVALIAEVERLREIETKVLDQSEFIQLHGLTVYEQARLRAEILQLRETLKARGLATDLLDSMPHS